VVKTRNVRTRRPWTLLRGAELDHRILHVVALELVGEDLLRRGACFCTQSRRAVQFHAEFTLRIFFTREVPGRQIGDAGKLAPGEVSRD